MNKKLIAIAVASVMAAPVAMADMKVSGRVAFDFTVKSKDGTAQDVQGWSDSGHGRIQFDGTAGNAYARIARDARLDKNLGNRDQYVGYKFGNGMTLQAGRMATAGKNLEKDPYIATFLETRNTAALVATASNYSSNGFVDNLLQLAFKTGSAKWKLQYDFSENAGNSVNDGHVGISVAGKGGGTFNYWASYNTGIADVDSDPLVSVPSQDNIKVGGAMKFGKVKVTLNYTSADTGLVNGSTDSIALGANMGFGSGWSGDLTYASKGADNAAAEADFWRIAAMKKLNKQASIYMGYTTTDVNAANSDTDEFGVGMFVKF